MNLFRRLVVPSFLTGLVGAVLLLSPLGPQLERGTGLAWLFTFRGAVSPPDTVVVGGIDSASAIALEQPSKLRNWDRSIHAQLLQKLVDMGATVIAFDIFFQESRSDADDSEFARQRSDQAMVYLQAAAPETGVVPTGVSIPTSVP